MGLEERSRLGTKGRFFRCVVGDPAGKVIPKDVRDEYCGRFGGGWEGRFHANAITPLGEAKSASMGSGGALLPALREDYRSWKSNARQAVSQFD